MSELNFEDKTKEELEAIAAEEEAQAEKAQQEADEAAARAAKEAKEAAEAKAAAEAALAAKVAEEAGTPVNTNDAELDDAWGRHCIRFGYNRSTPRPAGWTPQG
jgi:membrane protein involved in colicin uptake